MTCEDTLTYSDVIKLTIPVLTSGGAAIFAAYLGFKRACERDDRNVIQAAQVEVEYWSNKIPAQTGFREVCGQYEASKEALQRSIVHAKLLYPLSLQPDIHRAWQDYFNLHPDKLPDRDSASYNFDKAIAETMGDEMKEKRETAQQAIERTTKALRDSLNKIL